VFEDVDDMKKQPPICYVNNEYASPNTIQPMKARVRLKGDRDESVVEERPSTMLCEVTAE